MRHTKPEEVPDHLWPDIEEVWYLLRQKRSGRTYPDDDCLTAYQWAVLDGYYQAEAKVSMDEQEKSRKQAEAAQQAPSPQPSGHRTIPYQPGRMKVS